MKGQLHTVRPRQFWDGNDEDRAVLLYACGEAGIPPDQCAAVHWHADGTMSFTCYRVDAQGRHTVGRNMGAETYRKFFTPPPKMVNPIRAVMERLSRGH